jgi:hypothetical protein
MWTRVSSDSSSQLALEGRDQSEHKYPRTRGASWLRSAVRNVDGSSTLVKSGLLALLALPGLIGLLVTLQKWTRVDSWLSLDCLPCLACLP